jgi:hypothetical protein
MKPLEVQILLQRLGLVLPMFYVAITLMSDPARLIQLSRSVASVLDELGLPGMGKPRWKRYSSGTPANHLPEATRRKMQWCGAGIAAIALFLIAAA